MNRFQTFPFLLAILMAFSFSAVFISCNKNDDIIVPPGGTVVDSTKAIINIQVFFLSADSGTVKDALVGIGPNEDQVNSGFFLQSEFSNSLGKTSFDNLEPGTWYYRASKNISGVLYTDTGVITLEGGDEVDRRAVIR